MYGALSLTVITGGKRVKGYRQHYTTGYCPLLKTLGGTPYNELYGNVLHNVSMGKGALF